MTWINLDRIRPTIAKWVLGAAAILAFAPAADARTDVTRHLGCRDGTFNRICSEIRIRAFPLGNGQTHLIVDTSVHTEGILRQGSMRSFVNTGSRTSNNQNTMHSGVEYCSWNGIDRPGCTNSISLTFDCINDQWDIDFAAVADASSNLLDSVVFTHHGETFLAKYNACRGTFREF